MENIGIGELRSNPVADQCLKCFALYIKSIISLILKDICGYFQCAPFPRLQTEIVVWVLSFDP